MCFVLDFIEGDRFLFAVGGGLFWGFGEFGVLFGAQLEALGFPIFLD